MSQNPIKLFFGMQKYQQRLYFLLFFSAIFNAFLALIPNVALYIPDFECDLKHVLNVDVKGLQVGKVCIFVKFLV